MRTHLSAIYSCDYRFFFPFLPPPSPSFRFVFSPTRSCPSASLDYVVEPHFLGAGASGPGGPEFAAWAEDAKSRHGTVFGTSVGDLPPPRQPRCALISGRTADNPRLFTECIGAECATIFLEKPGAPTVAELQKMRDEASAAGVGVLMGYNKVRRGRAARRLFVFVRSFRSEYDRGRGVGFHPRECIIALERIIEIERAHEYINSPSLCML
jgi:hypothetical protein